MPLNWERKPRQNLKKKDTGLGHGIPYRRQGEGTPKSVLYKTARIN